ncbi:hypothetical protein [Nocardia farcinica]|uniref:hypothetical protein n=1 Tax=Nocardia farcinica TaxID=37329 RepID=UPI000A9F25E5
MHTNDSNPQPPHRYRWWYGHPLTSLLTATALAGLLIVPFGADTAALTLGGMLSFLTACRSAYGPGDSKA